MRNVEMNPNCKCWHKYRTYVATTNIVLVTCIQAQKYTLQWAAVFDPVFISVSRFPRTGNPLYRTEWKRHYVAEMIVGELLTFAFLPFLSDD